MAQTNIFKLYQDLLSEFGHPKTYWPQWCADQKNDVDREKIIIGTVLVQRTSWHNANMALKNLRDVDLLSLNQIAKITDINKLTQIIRPAGFYQSKPRCLMDLASYFAKNGGVAMSITQDFHQTRQQLLSIRGIGFETADTILLYALDKPAFIVDEYTKRWVKSHNLTDISDYQQLALFFQSQLPLDTIIYRNLHALIIISQRGREKSVMEVI